MHGEASSGFLDPANIKQKDINDITMITNVIIYFIKELILGTGIQLRFILKQGGASSPYHSLLLVTLVLSGG